MAYYLSKEEQRRRIIELAQKRGLDCPEMVVVQIDAGLGRVLVNYRCKEGGSPAGTPAPCRGRRVSRSRHESAGRRPVRGAMTFRNPHLYAAAP